ncbi:phospholipase A2 inhibitor and Ly6/PLAUR domain-containing protein isoform X2 [Anolis carolinensis]|uniref:phospholipase A2 inhibitor and Ly6/PLAUR domain-containing protein isoform X2 n=1 Tax=Anolis carolinensis TaxID=28377 RepID=UPI002F2B6CDD
MCLCGQARPAQTSHRNALYCEVCTSFGTSCTGSLQTCKDGNDTCIIAVAENTLVGQTLQTITKGCVSSSICKAGLTSMNFGQGKKIRSSTICCVGEACRTAVPQIPPLISQTNGKQCPACYAVSPSSCNEDEIVECVGSEDSCLDMAVTVTYGTFVVKTLQKGCVTKSVCDDIKTGETEMNEVHSFITKATCTAASSLA